MILAYLTKNVTKIYIPNEKYIIYKNKKFDIKLRPIFQTIAENLYNLSLKYANNRTSETSIKKG